jgi:serine/threonine-protein kinase
MQCPACRTLLDAGARFCGACGASLASAAAAPSAPGAAGNLQPAIAVSPVRAAGTGEPATAPPITAPPLAPSDPYAGKVLNNRFKIESKIGEGGFGAVYRGTQLGIGRPVAIKLLHPEMTRDQNLVARFRREGSVLCSLRDAHTITTYDFDQTPDGTLYIAMELLQGVSLHEVFHREAPLAWRRMLRLLADACSSLYEAHEQGIVHRDLKPENINLERRPGNDEFVKILDFGIAKVMRGDGAGSRAAQLTATGQTLGTLEYMSPEQLMGKQLDGRSDIYALGVLTYEMITGRLPFPDAVGPAALISAQLRSVPEPPSKACPGAEIPASVDALVLTMLEKDPSRRYANAMELRAQCEQLLAAPSPRAGSGPGPESQFELTNRASPRAMVRAPDGRGAGMPPAREPSTESMLEIARGPRGWLWVALLLLAIGGGIGVYVAFAAGS